MLGEISCARRRARLTAYQHCSKKEMKIRKATLEDSEEISRLTDQMGYASELMVIRTRVDRIIERTESLLLVCADNSNDGGLKGWVQADVNETIESGFRVEIVGLVVCERARQKGVGRLLVSEVEAWAMNLGIEVVGTRSNLTREESHIFYSNLGYSKTKSQTVYRKRIESDSNNSMDTIRYGRSATSTPAS